MRFIYIISAYKLPDLLIRLVHRLQSGNAAFFIHVDKKTSSNIFKQMREGLKNFDNVYFLNRHNCYWGDFGHVQATLKGIKELLTRDIYFDYVILLTGQDYPLKTNNNIENFFKKNQGYSFINYTSLPEKEWDIMDRIECHYYRFLGKTIRFPMDVSGGKFITVKKLINIFSPEKRKFFPGLTPYAGSGYWNLSREAVYYIANYVNQNPDFVRFFRNAFTSDELFFHTILLNSYLKDKMINDNLRHIDWSGRYGTSPTVFRTDDFNELCASPKLFARKFDTSIDSHILDMIDEKLLGFDRDKMNNP